VRVRHMTRDLTGKASTKADMHIRYEDLTKGATSET
jgi:hypothetical protein